MKKTVILYGATLALLTALLKALEYRYLVQNLSLEILMGISATIFTFLGVWIGFKITSRNSPGLNLSLGNPTPASTATPNTETNFQALNQEIFPATGLTTRECEVLELMAQGLSNQEIADHLFVSLSTVKTHSSNLYSKLGAKRRTQAIQKAKALRFIE